MNELRNVESNTATTAEAADTATADAPRVLVVDDVVDNRDILMRRLLRRGFAAMEASGGVEALDLINRERFDLILLDIMMPDLNGNEVLRTVRETRSADELPVIMVTAKTQSEDAVESLDLGANDYITKPVDFAVALARINTQLERKRKADRERAARQEVERRAADLHQIVERNVEGLRSMSEKLAREFSNRQKSEERLHYLAYHDALTGLLNRTAFQAMLSQALEDPEQRARQPALVFIDLDRFKAVNDVHGHDTGDRLLQEVAERLRRVAGPEVPLARLGGDEFATFTFEHGAPEAGMDLAQAVLDALREPFRLNDQRFQLGGSCGVAQAAVCDGRVDAMFKGADLALYRAKCGGRDRHVLYEARMLVEQRERSVLEVALRKAIETDGLEVHYQPLVRSTTRKVQAFEALVRWPHPERGMMRPDSFIPLAEETGLIVSLGNWVLREACREAAGWPSDVGVAVNLSPIQFRDPALVENIAKVLSATGLEPRRLELEITESALLIAGEQNAEILGGIRDLGIRVAMDDFGTGYCSMNYLQNFVFDKIKIDRRFVRGLTTTKNAPAIIKAIVDLSSSVGAETTAEGIETEEEMEAVVSHGCTEMQGYYFSKPLRAEEARSLVRRAPLPCADAGCAEIAAGSGGWQARG